MAGGSFRTELPTMGQAQQHVFDVNQQIQGELTKLWNQLAPLAGAWQGSASASFTQLHERWNAAAVKLNNALHGIGETLGANQRNYASSEETNLSGFNKIQAGLQ